ncbi:hypothetical protein [Bacillus yapensis]|nr:hypothetical protein [Bacillus yapensis]
MSDLIESTQALEISEQIEFFKLTMEKVFELVVKGEFQHCGGTGD